MLRVQETQTIATSVFLARTGATKEDVGMYIANVYKYDWSRFLINFSHELRYCRNLLWDAGKFEKEAIKILNP